MLCQCSIVHSPFRHPCVVVHLRDQDSDIHHQIFANITRAQSYQVVTSVSGYYHTVNQSAALARKGSNR